MDAMSSQSAGGAAWDYSLAGLGLGKLHTRDVVASRGQTHLEGVASELV